MQKKIADPIASMGRNPHDHSQTQAMSFSTELSKFVRSLPVGPAYAAIYKKGVVFGKNEFVSTGKVPHEKSHHQKFNPEDVALLLEKEPNKFQAIGLFTGIRSDGIVILDVDANLASLQKKWGDTIASAPKVISTKKNAAKYVFRVPADQRALVKGTTLSQSGMGYEILWGMQGVIAGAYPGSRSAKPGEYQMVAGSFDAIPDAPEWLLAEMRARKRQDTPVAGIVKNRRGLDFNGRTEDEIAEIIHDCLQVLPHLGRGSEDQWWQIGAMVAEALPTEQGLVLWSAWSAADPAFEDDWKDGNPCEEKWERLVERAGKRGNMGLGSLVKQADEYDPQRLRFQDSSRRTLEEVEKAQVQTYRQAQLSWPEIVSRYDEIILLENPGEIRHNLNALALDNRFKDVEALEKAIIDHQQFVSGNSKNIPWAEFKDKNYEQTYLIPDLVPSPSVILLYGAGGDGKSMASWALGKHIAMGYPFQIRGKNVPVQEGPVILLNGDQPMAQLQQQLLTIEMPDNAPLTIVPDWSLQWRGKFKGLIIEHRPRLVIIDSLIGCSGGSAFDENKSSFAAPLYWLARGNGTTFPPTSILIIHHANKQGGFRGTSAIRDAVDEVWALKRPSEAQQEALGSNARVITVEKSRSGRGGTSLLLKIDEDLCFNLSDYTPEIDPTETGPAGITDRVLARMRIVYPETRTRAQLNSDPIVGGHVKAIKKATQRWVDRGLLEIVDRIPNKNGGSPLHVYRAILSTPLSRVGGEAPGICPPGDNSSDTKESAGGQQGDREGDCPTAQELCRGRSSTETTEPVENRSPELQSRGTAPPGSLGCPPAEPLQDNETGQEDSFTEAIRAREELERTREELDKALEEAFDSWD
jgi:hypothetical protein